MCGTPWCACSNTSTPYGVTNINVLNSRITNNVEMGWLGRVRSGLRIEGSHFEGNNPSGSALWHAVYNGGGDNGGGDNPTPSPTPDDVASTGNGAGHPDNGGEPADSTPGAVR